MPYSPFQSYNVGEAYQQGFSQLGAGLGQGILNYAAGVSKLREEEKKDTEEADIYRKLVETAGLADPTSAKALSLSEAKGLVLGREFLLKQQEQQARNQAALQSQMLDLAQFEFGREKELTRLREDAAARASAQDFLRSLADDPDVTDAEFSKELANRPELLDEKQSAVVGRLREILTSGATRDLKERQLAIDERNAESAERNVSVREKESAAMLAGERPLTQLTVDGNTVGYSVPRGAKGLIPPTAATATTGQLIPATTPDGTAIPGIFINPMTGRPTARPLTFQESIAGISGALEPAPGASPIKPAGKAPAPVAEPTPGPLPAGQAPAILKQSENRADPPGFSPEFLSTDKSPGSRAPRKPTGGGSPAGPNTGGAGNAAPPDAVPTGGASSAAAPLDINKMLRQQIAAVMHERAVNTAAMRTGKSVEEVVDSDVYYVVLEQYLREAGMTIEEYVKIVTGEDPISTPDKTDGQGATGKPATGGEGKPAKK